MARRQAPPALVLLRGDPDRTPTPTPQADGCQFHGTWSEGVFVEGRWVWRDGSMFAGAFDASKPVSMWERGVTSRSCRATRAHALLPPTCRFLAQRRPRASTGSPAATSCRPVATTATGRGRGKM